MIGAAFDMLPWTLGAAQYDLNLHSEEPEPWHKFTRDYLELSQWHCIRSDTQNETWACGGRFAIVQVEGGFRCIGSKGMLLPLTHKYQRILASPHSLSQ